MICGCSWAVTEEVKGCLGLKEVYGNKWLAFIPV
jgi:hypothetical protein